MEIQNIITIIVTIVFALAGIWILHHEWSELSSKKMLIYGIIMMVVQVALAVALMYFYPKETICMHLKRLGLLSIIWPAAVIDWKFSRIPNLIILTGLGFRVVMLIPEFILERDTMLVTLASEGIAFAAITVITLFFVLVMKNSVGMGDLKLMMVMALLQGVEGFMTSAFFTLCAAFVVAVFMLITKRKTRKDAIPFAPCILFGTLLGVFLTGM
jgi:leader peptidase (prepilin peptidase)/N-methyltransferase